MSPERGNRELYFGGPDRPPRILRDILEAKVGAVPSGGEISWATYYFRDRALAEALIAASDRGVGVRLCVEGDPRRKGTNDAVIEMLRQHGLNGGLCVYGTPGLPFRGLRGRMHAKIYAFSHPHPVALVGSFNPSGDEPEDMDVVADLGDQDRGHNYLLELEGPRLVAALTGHVAAIARHGRLQRRLSPRQNRVVTDGDTALYFFPRLSPDVVAPDLERLGRGQRLRGAISHLKGRMVALLCDAAARGVEVKLLVHDTERRVPQAAIVALRAAGVDVKRYVDPERLPMHCKFLLTETESETAAWLGSFNFNPNSRLLNDEVLLRCTEAGVADTLSRRFEQIAADCARFNA